MHTSSWLPMGGKRFLQADVPALEADRQADNENHYAWSLCSDGTQKSRGGWRGGGWGYWTEPELGLADSSMTSFLKIGTIAMLSDIILWLGTCSGYCRMFNSILDLYSLDVCKQPLDLVIFTKMFPDVSWGQNHPHLRITVLWQVFPSRYHLQTML